MGIIRALQVFVQAYIMTEGGPADATLFYVLQLYRTAFLYFRMGYASLLAWILFIYVLILTLLVLRSSRAWVYYETEAKGGAMMDTSTSASTPSLATIHEEARRAERVRRFGRGIYGAVDSPCARPYRTALPVSFCLDGLHIPQRARPGSLSTHPSLFPIPFGSQTIPRP